MNILALAKENYAYAVSLRRYFHEYPECGPKEQTETMDAIEKQLDALGIRHVRVAGGGIYGFIEGPAGGRTLLMRADIDGLPVCEDADNLKGSKVCVSKKPGIMHGCGHDAHMAMLLAEAKILQENRAELKGSVILMFEEGEEGFLNCEPMARYLEREHIAYDGAYATHVRWDLPAGKIALSPKAAMAGLMAFRLVLEGVTGHGSRPDLACSTIDCFSRIYTAMQGIRLSRIRPDSPLTWSIGTLQAGSSYNVIPAHLECEGTIRMFDVDCGETFWAEMNRVIAHTAAMCGCKATLARTLYLLPTRSDAACLALLRTTAAQTLGADAVIDSEPWMASESFSYISSLHPSVFPFIGIRNEQLGSGANHHTPQFDIDEKSMLCGIAAAVSYAAAFLAAPPDCSDFRPVCNGAEELISMLHKDSIVEYKASSEPI